MIKYKNYAIFYVSKPVSKNKMLSINYSLKNYNLKSKNNEYNY